MKLRIRVIRDSGSMYRLMLLVNKAKKGETSKSPRANPWTFWPEGPLKLQLRASKVQWYWFWYNWYRNENNYVRVCDEYRWPLVRDITDVTVIHILKFPGIQTSSLSSYFLFAASGSVLYILSITAVPVPMLFWCLALGLFSFTFNCFFFS